MIKLCCVAFMNEREKTPVLELTLVDFPYLATPAPTKRLLKISEIKPDTFQVTFHVSQILGGSRQIFFFHFWKALRAKTAVYTTNPTRELL